MLPSVVIRAKILRMGCSTFQTATPSSTCLYLSYPMVIDPPPPANPKRPYSLHPTTDPCTIDVRSTWHSGIQPRRWIGNVVEQA
ncbi:hypothetical protein BJX70DRAFT_373865 [Aspergillus crustosus]